MPLTDRLLGGPGSGAAQSEGDRSMETVEVSSQRLAPPGLVRFAQADPTVFVSYAHADNELCGNWVGDFADEVKQQLSAALARDLGRLPEGRSREITVHLSEQNGPCSGDLLEELRRRVRSCFAMVIVVHDSYLDSPWCLKELELFHEAFGTPGLDQRLYVLALSAGSIRKLEGSPGWKAVFHGRNQVWKPFFQNDVRGRYIPVLRPDGRAASIEFEDGFEPLRRDMIAKIRRDLMAGPVREPVPLPAMTQAEVEVETAAPGPLLFGVCRPELAEEVQRLADQIEAAGQTVKILQAADLRSGFGDFALAQALVLPFNDGQPLDDDLTAGGHLAIQKRAWLKRKRPLASLITLDLGYIAATLAADEENRAVIEEMRQGAFDEHTLLARWAPPAVREPEKAPPGNDDTVIRLYIESNRIERREWKLLGRRIQERWRELLARQQIDSHLRLRPLGLPVDELDGSICLDSADGFILLWGQKDKRSLLSQINKVEKQTRDYVPGIVAFLSPPQPRPEEAVPALGWEVLRFESAKEPIWVDEEDHDDLCDFLGEVLERHHRRRQAAAPRRAA